MNNINVVVVGVGNIGSAHASTLFLNKIDGMRLYGVCDINEQVLKNCEQNFKGVKLVDSFDTVLSDNNVDAVIISTPHPLHADMAILALNASKHVLVEKPVDIRVSKANELNTVAKATNKVFAIMFNQRTNNLYQKAKELVSSGALGELKRSVWIITNWYRTQYYYDSGSWRATWRGEGGGVLLNQAPHNLDLWQWICGMPQSIIAFCDFAKYHNIEVEDDVTIYAKYQNGATGTFITSTGELPGTNRLEISGTLGKIVIEDKKLKWYKLDQDEREICKTLKKSSFSQKPQYIEFDYKESPTHAKILQNFADSINFGTPLIANGCEGINQLMLTNAAYLSAHTNRTVELPVNEREYDELLNIKISNSKQLKNNAAKQINTSYNERWQTKW